MTPDSQGSPDSPAESHSDLPLDLPPDLPPDLPSLPAREASGHKGTYGRVLLIGGSRGMTGAAALMGMSALRAGAGLVKLAVPDRCLEHVAAFEPSYMTTPLASDSEGRMAAQASLQLPELLAASNSVACGPGLGQSEAIRGVIGWLYQACEAPLVVDADGLNALAKQPQRLRSGTHAGPRILTPHPGEFGRLLGDSDCSVAEMRSRAPDWAARHQVILVLKGHCTLITDGQRTHENPTGNPGLATGGTGDVLTGVVAALLGQGLTPYDAARLAVFVHGLAGDLAAERVGPVSLIARDVIDELPRAIQRVVEAD